MASVYKRAPIRALQNASEEQAKGIEEIYKSSRINVALKRANQKYKLHEQCTLQVLPKDGKLYVRILAPHQFDVIPDPDMPERAMAYIISSYDRLQLDTELMNKSDIQGKYIGSPNETTSLESQVLEADSAENSNKRYVIWTKDEILKVNRAGGILEREENPLKALPFVDVAGEKDFEYWIRRGSGVVEFNLDFSVVLSDTCNTNRLQSYAQAVIIAEKIPQNMTVGPQHVLFLQLDPNRPEVKPSFGFANPQPDMKASLDLQDRLLNYFMSSKGIDPKTVNSSGETTKYNSGLDRLLAMIDRFEASQDDLDLFQSVEQKVYKLLRDWYEVVAGTALLDSDLNFGQWPESIELNTVFTPPEIVTTQKDKEDSVVNRIENRLMSRVEGIMELRQVDEPAARKILAQIDKENTLPVDTNNFPEQA